MNNTKKLSHWLLDLGFLCVLGTTERGQLVLLGLPLTHDSNNGIMVLYDEAGRPWIKRYRPTAPEVLGKLNDLVNEFQVMHGANVPHSNDGGGYLRDMEETMAKIPVRLEA